MAPQNATSADSVARPQPGAWSRLRWPVLAALYLALALLLSVVQPLGRTPDEGAHVQYIAFVADHHRLPLFLPAGGGEAGYEAQHPPLYYAVMAIPWRLSAGLEDRWRWQLLRWLTILLVGGGTFYICMRMFRRVWAAHDSLAWAATATTMLMPLTILYTGYINPDGMAMLWATAAVCLSIEVAVSRPSHMRALALGMVLAAAALTKISALPTALVAAVAFYLAAKRSGWRAVAPDAGIALGALVAMSGWWYARNLYLYGSPLVKTAAPYGSGLDNALATGHAGFYAWLTIRETFLSSWAQRGWFPAGALEYLLYAVILVYTIGAVVGWAAGRQSPGRITGARLRRQRAAVGLMALLLAAVVAGQQAAFWLSDVEFNAGGRYVLMGMSGIALLGLAGWARLLSRRWVLVAVGLWLVAIVVMDLASAWNIVAVLNPRYAPGWQLFHFPPG